MPPNVSRISITDLTNGFRATGKRILGANESELPSHVIPPIFW